MSILNIFKKKYKPEVTVELMFYLANADKDISSSEIKYIQKLASDLEIPYSEVKKILDRTFIIPFEKSNLKLPTDNNEKYQLLHSLISLMMVDGEIHIDEYKFCQKIADKLGVKNKGIDELIGKYINSDHLKNYNSLKAQFEMDFEKIKNQTFNPKNTSLSSKEIEFSEFVVKRIEIEGKDIIDFPKLYEIAVECYEFGCQRNNSISFSKWLHWKDVKDLKGTELPKIPIETLSKHLDDVIKIRLMIRRMVHLLKDDIGMLIPILNTFDNNGKIETVGIVLNGIIGFASDNIKTKK